MAMQIRVRSPGREFEIDRAAFWVKAPSHGDCLQQCRFTAPILADYEGHIRMEGNSAEISNRREIERVVILRQLFSLQRDFAEVGFGRVLHFPKKKIALEKLTNKMMPVEQL